MEAKPEISLTIDGREVVVPEGTTILEAARQNGIRIPTLCHHEALAPWGGCRLCVVEVDGAPKLVASCVMPVRSGMDVKTTNERIIESRRIILEFIFSERNHYCMYCAQSGDCELQDLAYEHQMHHLTVPPLDQGYPVDATHPDMVMDHNRCVLCGRCVRACRELAGASVLDFHNRGGQTMIGVDLSGNLAGSTCASCGVCLQVCPTGAIFQRHRTHYAVKGKPKHWTTVESCCPECGSLCSTVSYVQDNNLLKIEGVIPGDGPDRGQLCGRGRFGPLLTVAPRLHAPMARAKNGEWEKIGWEKAWDMAAQGLGAVAKAHGPQAVWGLVSSASSNEELKSLKELLGSNGLDTLDGDLFRNVSAAQAAIKAPVEEAPLAAILDADLVLAVGVDPEKTQPLACSFARRALYEKKTKLMVIGSDNALGPLAHLHLKVADDDLPSLLKALLSAVSQNGGAKAPQDFAKGEDFAKVAEAIKKSRSPIILAGLDAGRPGAPEALTNLVKLAEHKAMARAKNLPIIVLKPYGNSAGAWTQGLASSQGIKGHDGLKGCLLWLSGETSLPPALAARLNGLEFLAVVSPYFPTSVTEKAQLVIPKPGWLEADGTYTYSDGSGSRFKKKVLNPPEDVRPAQETLAALAGRWGSVLPGGGRRGKNR